MLTDLHMGDARKKRQKFDYQAFLVEKHARRTTPDPVINAAVKKATGSSLLSKKRLIVGAINEVYEATTRSGRNIIIRISHHEHSGFEQERWAIEQCRRIGVPVPAVLLVDDFQADSDALSVCVETKLEGDSVESLMALLRHDRKILRGIIQSAGAILAKIHSVKTEAFGNLDETGTGNRASWTDYMLRLEQRRERLRGVASKIDLDPALIEQALHILRRHQELYHDVSPHLLHGDYRLQHIFVKDSTITGIIDFENCKSGDPAYDFARWHFFYEPRVPMDWLQQGYGERVLFGVEYETRLRLARLALGLALLHYYDSVGNPDGLNFTVRNVKADMQHFR